MKGSWPYFLWGMGWALWIPNKKILVGKLWNLPEIHCFRKARSRDFGWTFLGEGWRWKKQQMILEKCFDFCFSWLRPNIYLNMYFSPKRMWTKPAEFFTKSRAWYKTRQDSLGPVQNNQNIRIQTPHKSHPTFFFRERSCRCRRCDIHRALRWGPLSVLDHYPTWVLVNFSRTYFSEWESRIFFGGVQEKHKTSTHIKKNRKFALGRNFGLGWDDRLSLFEHWILFIETPETLMDDSKHRTFSIWGRKVLLFPLKWLRR